MNIETLRLISQIIESRSITKVAERENISQSALSQHIKSIESRLGVQLFDRTNRGLIPTVEGETFYRYAKNIVDCYHSLLREFEENKRNFTKLTIYANPLFSSYALPCTLFDLQTHFPEINMDMIVLPSLLVEQKILSGEGDIGFINGKPQSTQLWSQSVLVDPIHLVVKYDSVLPEQILPNDLYLFPLIMSSGRSVTRDTIDEGLRRNNVRIEKLTIKHHMDTIESVKLSVLNGYCLSFLPYSSIKKELYLKQLRIIELKDVSIANEFYLILNKQFIAKNKPLNEVVEYLKNVLSDTLC